MPGVRTIEPISPPIRTDDGMLVAVEEADPPWLEGEHVRIDGRAYKVLDRTRWSTEPAADVPGIGLLVELLGVLRQQR